MKKCASCTKDLPEAALHCVFCGAKQPPAPAVQPGLAKTAFGYSNEMMEQLKNPGAAPSAGPGPGSQRPSQPPYTPSPQQAYSPPPQQPPRDQRPSQPPYGGGLAPTAPAHAATMFVQGGPPGMQPPQPQAQPIAQPYQQPYVPPPQVNQAALMQTAVATPPQASAYQPVPVPQTPGMGINAPHAHGNQTQAIPPPYQGGQRPGMRPSGRPVEPWKSSLPFMMIVWGLATLVAFATPTRINPLSFNWDVILHGEMVQKVPMLLIAAIGLVGLIVGALPMPVMPRGILATVLGLSGVVVPIVMAAVLGAPMPPWQFLAPLIGIALILPGLLLRGSYVESLLARLLVTFGVIAVLLPMIVPEHGQIPLVNLFKALLDGHIHGNSILALALIVFVVINLLVWLPGPSAAGANLFAWVWMLAPLIVLGFSLSEDLGKVVDIAKAAPQMLVSWVPMTTCAVFFGYGLASVLGKQLE